MVSPSVAARRGAILEAYETALGAVDAGNATRRALAGADLEGDDAPLTIVAIGKAAVPMAAAAVDTIPGRGLRGIAVDAEGVGSVTGIEVRRGDHPYPAEHSVAAGAAVAEAVESAPGHVLFLVSGGASSLVELPAADLTIEDTGATARLLLEGGVDIERLNVVRTALSRLKGGRLRRLARARGVTTLIVSDVIGDDPTAIASGPTVRPRSTTHRADARRILDDAGVWDRTPEPVRRYLTGPVEESSDALFDDPWPYDDRVDVIATGTLAASAAADHLGSGVVVHLQSTAIEGDAVEAAARFTTSPGPMVHVGYGETTVTVRGSGTGGRNQHAALSVANRISGTSHVFAALSTDGIDGSSRAAGAIVDGGTVDRCRSHAVDPVAELAACNSTVALAASGDLVETGPSGTNVGDLWIWWPGDQT